MNKVMVSGIILLVSFIILVWDIVLALKLPWLWLAVIGMIAVTYGIYDWHMGIIHNYKKAK
ncbi:hypothetical protein J2Z60_001738 [Lactobacillus colini]|uniref:Uncharacterized protein n=1 Tax=Lactobacillus colini TaxID=1819254 RepID=A0ABS4MFU0_9LACO|nr:hypothetical protein [Lactobacillus colini]MBP2058553.1 hypothetical protein [Lactobacillus colini]